MIGIILHGHSIQEFIEKREDVLVSGIEWVGINDYDFTTRVLGKDPDYMIAFSKDVHLNEIGCRYITESKNRGNSLFEFLMQCEEKGTDNVFLFGADGYSETEIPYHKERRNDQLEYKVQGHKRDTDYLNANFPHTKMKIYNVNNSSKYTPFEIISYNTFIKRFK